MKNIRMKSIRTKKYSPYTNEKCTNENYTNGKCINDNYTNEKKVYRCKNIYGWKVYELQVYE